MRYLEEKIGNTSLARLEWIERARGVNARLYAKRENENFGGSIKDRVAQAILDDAEKSGRLKPGGTVVEATSGNTGIGLSLVAKARGYQTVIVMPDTMSVERREMIVNAGGRVELTAGSEGMQGSLERANALVRSMKNAVLADQFNNPVCAEVHYRKTGAELWRQTEGKADIFIACVGTGGTLTGIGRYLKEKNPAIRVIAVEPAYSPLLSQGRTGSHKIQGIGANFIPAVLDKNIYDEVITVTDEEAYAFCRELQSQGEYVGISSGAAVAAAVKVAKRAENAEKNIVTVFPDRGDRYTSVL